MSPLPHAEKPTVLSTLVATTPEVASAQALRPEVATLIEQAYGETFDSPGTLTTATRHGIAALVARWHQHAAVYTLHVQAGADDHLYTDALPADESLRILVQHVDSVTVSAALTTEADQQRLAAAGFSEDDVMLVSQIIAYTSFQIRYAFGLAILSGTAVEHTPAPARSIPVEGRTKEHRDLARNGRPRPNEYTRDTLSWTPWVAPAPINDLTEEQVEVLAGKTNGEYFRLLARQPKILKTRSAIDKAIFYGRGGLPRAERELAAAATSKVTDCIYCASVHARKSAQLSKREDDVQRLLDQTLIRDNRWLPESIAPLAAGQDARWTAIITASAELASLPPRLSPESVDAALAARLSLAEVLDVIGSTAFFTWANRLMLSLGEPFRPDPED